MDTATMQAATEVAVQIPAEDAILQGDLALPPQPRGLVIFAHGSGSSRHSPRNRYVAGVLQQAGLGTLLMDLLTVDEEAVDQYTRHLRFDIPLLSGRLVAATDWAKDEEQLRGLNIGYFGASTGAAAAIMAAAQRSDQVKAIVSRGGRPDLAEAALEQIQAATLLLVGDRDYPVIDLNEQAFERMKCEKRLTLVPRATHLFEEPGTLEQVAELAASWFGTHL
ncbi:MAG: dienelactone hydrolase family protein [Armatimonadia bacterium]